jgi:hypothetical protein
VREGGGSSSGLLPYSKNDTKEIQEIQRLGSKRIAVAASSFFVFGSC